MAENLTINWVSDLEIPNFWEIFCQVNPTSCVDSVSTWIKKHRRLSILNRYCFFLIKKNFKPIACVELRKETLTRFSVLPSYLDLGNEILELILDKARNLRLTLLKAYYDERYHFFFQNHGFRVKYLRYLKQKKIEKVSHLNKIEQCGFDLQSIHQDDVKELADFFYPVYYGDIDFQHGIAANTRNEWEEEVQKNLNGQYGRFLSSSSFIMRDSITKSVLGSIFVCHWASKTAKITVIGVSKKNQRQGIGSFLIQKSIESLVRKGYQYLQLDVTAGNTPAERLYDKLGFEKIAGEYTADKSL